MTDFYIGGMVTSQMLASQTAIPLCDLLYGHGLAVITAWQDSIRLIQNTRAERQRRGGGARRMERFWCEVTVAVPREWLEPAAAALNALGANGVVVMGGAPDGADEWAAPPECLPIGVQAYFPVDDLLGGRLEEFRERLALAAVELGEPPTEISLRRVAEADWAEAWKAYYGPVRVGGILIVPSWEEYDPKRGETCIRMDPGLAFGAGTHPTTRQALLLLQGNLARGGRVLDIGTGCGILAIAAARLGAGRILARDVDPIAVDTARANADTNGMAGGIIIERGDLLTGVDGQFDLVLANLVAPLILDLLPTLPRCLAAGGKAALAGIIAARAEEVRAAAEQAGLRIVEELRDGEWVAFLAEK